MDTQVAEPEKRAKNSHIWEKEQHNWYVEPEWCGQRLFQAEKFAGEIHNPACGMGRILAGAAAAGHNHLTGADIVDRASGFPSGCDFLQTSVRHDNIVSNPPYHLAREFVEHALRLADRKVAMLLPYGWAYGVERSQWLETTPLRRIFFISPRPSMPPGHVILAGTKPQGGRVDYCWLVWHVGYDGYPEIRWLRRDG